MPTRSEAGAFGQPDQSFDSLKLAKKETPILALLRVAPVLQKSFSNATYAGIAGFAPCVHARADLVNQRKLDEDARVVECFEDSEART